MQHILRVLLEATAIGLLLIPLTYAVSYILKPIMKKPSLPEVCGSWNQFYVMEVTLFAAGFLFHVLLEFLGVNRYYAIHYFD